MVAYANKYFLLPCNLVLPQEIKLKGDNWKNNFAKFLCNFTMKRLPCIKMFINSETFFSTEYWLYTGEKINRFCIYISNIST